jgi:hypothetical protein
MDAGDQEKLKKFKLVSSLASDLHSKIEKLKREDPFVGNSELTAAQKELVEEQQQMSEPGSPVRLGTTSCTFNL